MVVDDLTRRLWVQRSVHAFSLQFPTLISNLRLVRGMTRPCKEAGEGIQWQAAPHSPSSDSDSDNRIGPCMMYQIQREGSGTAWAESSVEAVSGPYTLVVGKKCYVCESTSLLHALVETFQGASR